MQDIIDIAEELKKLNFKKETDYYCKEIYFNPNNVNNYYYIKIYLKKEGIKVYKWEFWDEDKLHCNYKSDYKWDEKNNLIKNLKRVIKESIF